MQTKKSKLKEEEREGLQINNHIINQFSSVTEAKIIEGRTGFQIYEISLVRVASDISGSVSTESADFLESSSSSLSSPPS